MEIGTGVTVTVGLGLPQPMSWDVVELPPADAFVETLRQHRAAQEELAEAEKVWKAVSS